MNSAHKPTMNLAKPNRVEDALMQLKSELRQFGLNPSEWSVSGHHDMGNRLRLVNRNDTSFELELAVTTTEFSGSAIHSLAVVSF